MHIRKKDQDKKFKIELVDYVDDGYVVVVYKKHVDGSWIAWYVEDFNMDNYKQAIACFEREVLKYVSKQV